MFWRKKAELQKLPLPRAVFLKLSSVGSISESFGKPRLSVILTNQCPTIMVIRSRTETVMMTLPMCGSRGG